MPCKEKLIVHAYYSEQFSGSDLLESVYIPWDIQEFSLRFFYLKGYCYNSFL